MLLKRVRELAKRDPLAALQLTAEARKELDTIEAEIVSDLRTADPPATWDQIADALGMTKQAAHLRHGKRTGRLKER